MNLKLLLGVIPLPNTPYQIHQNFFKEKCLQNQTQVIWILVIFQDYFLVLDDLQLQITIHPW